MISRKIVSPNSESVGSDVLHVCVHGVELNTNDLAVFESVGLTKMERIACRSGKMVPIRTQLSNIMGRSTDLQYGLAVRRNYVVEQSYV